MSASIMWRPTGGSKSLGVSAPSSFIEAMGATFGQGPWKIGEAHIPTLRAMAAVYSHQDNPYAKLAEIIETRGEVEVWAEY